MQKTANYEEGENSLIEEHLFSDNFTSNLGSLSTARNNNSILLKIRVHFAFLLAGLQISKYDKKLCHQSELILNHGRGKELYLGMRKEIFRAVKYFEVAKAISQISVWLY